MLDLLWGQEDACRKKTEEALRSGALGDKAPKCLAVLGDVLSLLDRASSCWWGCHGGPHALEYCVGRAVSAASAALRLLFLGCYDESLAISRTAGELANLLFLFALSKTLHDQWETLGPKERYREFSPAKVRRHLEALKAPILVNESLYGPMSQLVHATTSGGPQSHNVLGVPLRAEFQEAGFLIALNELAWAIACVGIAIHRVIGIPTSEADSLANASELLAIQIGQARVNTIDEYWAGVRAHPGFAEAERKVREAFKQRHQESGRDDLQAPLSHEPKDGHGDD